MCRREMEKQESELSKKDSIIQDYKTITTRLSLRLEQMQDSSRVQLGDFEVMQRRVRSPTLIRLCLLYQDGVGQNCGAAAKSPGRESYVRQIQELELELARTKLSKVESECKVQVGTQFTIMGVPKESV